MPDVVCDGTPAFVAQEMAAIVLVLLYCVVVPTGLWLRLFILKDKGRLHDGEVQQSYGWCDPSFDQSLLDVSDPQRWQVSAEVPQRESVARAPALRLGPPQDKH